MNEQDRMRLAVTTKVSLKTVITWDRGEGVSGSMEKLLTDAAAELGILENRKAQPEPKAS